MLLYVANNTNRHPERLEQRRNIILPMIPNFLVTDNIIMS